MFLENDKLSLFLQDLNLSPLPTCLNIYMILGDLTKVYHSKYYTPIVNFIKIVLREVYKSVD